MDAFDKSSPPGPSTRSGTGDPLRRRPLRRLLRNWRLRHQHPFNFAIHLVGIPLAVAGAGMFFVAAGWPWALGGLGAGYLLQYIGHRVEGNDVGEWAAIKRLVGLPYVGIAPQYQRPESL